MEWVTLITALGLFVSAAILFYWRGRRERRLLGEIPGYRGWPIIGGLHIFLRPREELPMAAVKMVEDYGPIMYVSTLGVTRIVVSGPEAIQVLLNSPNLTKDSSYNFIKPWLGTGLLTSTDDKWRTRRHMLTPCFHYRILKDFVGVFNANSAILVEELRKHMTEEYVEINDYVALCALDNICETAMGTCVHAQKGGGVEYVKAVKRMCTLFVDRHFAPWLHPDFVYYLSKWGKEQKRVVQVLQDFSAKIIQKKILEYEERKEKENAMHNNIASRSKGKTSILDMLLEMSHQEATLSDEDIREEVNTFMFAGHDTTAAAVGWAIFTLGSHQDVQDKVASELSEIFGEDRRQPTMADFNEMVYLEKVVKEVLRLYPSVPAISRIMDTDVSVGGYTIPAGTNVMVVPLLLHWNSQVYADPQKFDPERFSPEQISARHPYAYIPFSAGPRNCIGRKFARLEIMSILSSLLRVFTLETLEKEKMALTPDIVLKPKYPFKVKISHRVLSEYVGNNLKDVSQN